MLKKAIFVFAAIIVFAGATIVNQCGTEIPFPDSELVTVSNCEIPTCMLKQGTTVTLTIKIVPSRTVQKLLNDVNAIIANVSVPLIGIDETNACDDIYNKDGTKAFCPLQQGVEYIYKNSFPVLSFYPKVEALVRYALREEDERLLCFDIATKITK